MSLGQPCWVAPDIRSSPGMERGDMKRPFHDLYLQPVVTPDLSLQP